MEILIIKQSWDFATLGTLHSPESLFIGIILTLGKLMNCYICIQPQESVVKEKKIKNLLPQCSNIKNKEVATHWPVHTIFSGNVKNVPDFLNVQHL